MAIELTILALSAGLGLFQIVIAVAAVTKQRGAKWNAGPRDAVLPAPIGVAGRLDRASNNFKETFPLFVAGVFLAYAAGTLGGISATGAMMYLIARVIYVPIYAAGIPYIRSLIWAIATLGIILVYVSLF